MIDKTNEPDEYVIPGTLISGNRSLILSIVCLVLIVWVAAIGLTVLAMSLLFVFLVLVSYRIMRPLGAGWHERVQIVIRSDGLMIIRANGRSNFTDWDTFEAVRLEELAFNDSVAYSKGQYKLSFINRYKPTISAFIHTKTAEKAVFLLPVEFAVELPQQEATNLQKTLMNLVESEQSNETTLVHETPDLDKLLKLKSCMQCLYSLRGIGRDGNCPECGWKFDRSMLLIDGNIFKKSQHHVASQVLGILTIVGAILGFMISSTMVILTFTIGIAAITIAIPTIIGRRGTHKILATDRGLEEWHGTKLTISHSWNNVGTLYSIEDEFSRTRIAMWHDKKDFIRFNSFFRYWITSPLGKPIVDIFVHTTPEVGRLIICELKRRWKNSSTNMNQTTQPS